eukprot:scaffold34694_cov253-Amphora_coffeaeformis.AAC.1
MGGGWGVGKGARGNTAMGEAGGGRRRTAKRGWRGLAKAVVPLKWRGKWAGGGEKVRVQGALRRRRRRRRTAKDGKKGRCRANAITPGGRRGHAKAVVPLKWRGKWAGGWEVGKGARGNTATTDGERGWRGLAKAVVPLKWRGKWAGGGEKVRVQGETRRWGRRTADGEKGPERSSKGSGPRRSGEENGPGVGE